MRRAGLAAGRQLSDDQARDANFGLMQQRRKQQLEQQLEEKVELLKQYQNPRGFGMRGRSDVPQRDIDMLQQQIEGIRRQLAEMMSGGLGTPASSSASSLAATPHTGQRPTPHSGMPVTPGSAVGAAGATPGGRASNMPRTKRDEVWERKYAAWLTRGGQSLPPSMSATPVASARSLTTTEGLWDALKQPAGPSAPPAPVPPLPTPYGASQQQQQDGPRFGRRATPPTEQPRPTALQPTALSQFPVANGSSQPNVFGGAAGAQGQPQRQGSAGFGRRAANQPTAAPGGGGTRPW
jgi:hypothetical protein